MFRSWSISHLAFRHTLFCGIIVGCVLLFAKIFNISFIVDHASAYLMVAVYALIVGFITEPKSNLVGLITYAGLIYVGYLLFNPESDYPDFIGLKWKYIISLIIGFLLGIIDGVYAWHNIDDVISRRMKYKSSGVNLLDFSFAYVIDRTFACAASNATCLFLFLLLISPQCKIIIAHGAGEDISIVEPTVKSSDSRECDITDTTIAYTKLKDMDASGNKDEAQKSSAKEDRPSPKKPLVIITICLLISLGVTQIWRKKSNKKDIFYKSKQNNLSKKATIVVEAFHDALKCHPRITNDTIESIHSKYYDLSVRNQIKIWKAIEADVKDIFNQDNGDLQTLDCYFDLLLGLKPAPMLYFIEAAEKFVENLPVTEWNIALAEHLLDIPEIYSLCYDTESIVDYYDKAILSNASRQFGNYFSIDRDYNTSYKKIIVINDNNGFISFLSKYYRQSISSENEADIIKDTYAHFDECGIDYKKISSGSPTTISFARDMIVYRCQNEKNYIPFKDITKILLLNDYSYIVSGMYVKIISKKNKTTYFSTDSRVDTLKLFNLIKLKVDAFKTKKDFTKSSAADIISEAEMPIPEIHKRVLNPCVHFAMYNQEWQYGLFDNNIFALSLCECDEESWRTNAIKRCNNDDLIFLFQKGGSGYIGAFLAKGWLVIETDGQREILSIKKNMFDHAKDDEELLPETEWPLLIKKYLAQSFIDEGYTLISYLIVEPLIFYQDGVGSLSIYRRTISSYDSSYAWTTLARFKCILETQAASDINHYMSNKTSRPILTNNYALQNIFAENHIISSNWDYQDGWTDI